MISKLIHTHTYRESDDHDGPLPHQYLPTTNWLMQCNCPSWSVKSQESSWRQFISEAVIWIHIYYVFKCGSNEFLSGLAYQYNPSSGNYSWWGRCTEFHGHYVNSICWELPPFLTDGSNGSLTLPNPMMVFHRVIDFPARGSQSTNIRRRQFQVCHVQTGNTKK